MKVPNFPDNIGKSRSIIGIGGDQREFTVIDEIRHNPADNPKKLFYLQKLLFTGKRTPEFRLGYYMIGKKPGKTKGRWVWAPFAPMMSAKDFRAIIKKARLKYWL